MAALIIGSGSDLRRDRIENIHIEYVICADGGLEKVQGLNLKPDLILGDFDSVNSSLLNGYRGSGTEIYAFPPEKDFTDMELAVDTAVKRGFKEIVLIGASGTRLDHTLANIQLLEKYHRQGISIEIIDNNNHIGIISGKTDINIKKKTEHFVSLVPVTETLEGLTLKGFKYPLNNVTVERGTALLISNEIRSEEGRIILDKGTALIFISKD